MKGTVIGTYQATARATLIQRIPVADLALERIRCGMANGTSIDTEFKMYAATSRPLRNDFRRLTKHDGLQHSFSGGRAGGSNVPFREVSFGLQISSLVAC